MASMLFYFFITLLLVSCRTLVTEHPPLFAIMVSSQDTDDALVFPDSKEYGKSEYSLNPPTTSTTPDPNRILFNAPSIGCRKCYRLVQGECRKIVGCRLRDP
uniref:Uncharacterized protein n=1 Tax=Cuerna arida TaxID=1464854 RepID=A0A1B6EPI1_9HEMI